MLFSWKLIFWDIFDDFFSKMGLLSEVSPKKEVREHAHGVATILSDKLVDIEYDRDLYIALVEYYEGNFFDEKKKIFKSLERQMPRTQLVNCNKNIFEFENISLNLRLTASKPSARYGSDKDKRNVWKQKL